MEVNKTDNKLNNCFNKAKSISKDQNASGSALKKTPGNISADKVSISNYKSDNNDHYFAKLELAKLNETSVKKLQSFKVKLTEYEEAIKVSPEKAQETELGQKVNNPAIWEDIAHKMLR